MVKTVVFGSVSTILIALRAPIRSRNVDLTHLSSVNYSNQHSGGGLETWFAVCVHCGGIVLSPPPPSPLSPFLLSFLPSFAFLCLRLRYFTGLGSVSSSLKTWGTFVSKVTRMSPMRTCPLRDLQHLEQGLAQSRAQLTLVEAGPFQLSCSINSLIILFKKRRTKAAAW